MDNLTVHLDAHSMRKEAAKAKKNAMQKDEVKMKHLRKKFRKSEGEKIDMIPEALKNLRLENLSIFCRKKFEEKKAFDYEVEVIGEMTLSNNERMMLKSPPKFAIEDNLPEEGLALDEELAFAKARMTIAKEEGEKPYEEDEGIEDEEEATKQPKRRSTGEPIRR